MTSKNAMKHGLYSTEVVLPWESQVEFDGLHDALREEYCPDGRSEDLAVFNLASLHWKKRRLNVGSLLAYQKQPEADAMTEAAKKGWKGIAEYFATSTEGDLSDRMRGHLNQCNLGLQQLGDMITRAALSFDTLDDTKRQRLSAILDQLRDCTKIYASLNKDAILPMFSLIQSRELDQKLAERAYRPHFLEKEMKLRAEIDRQIEKTMRALVITKEFKNQYLPKPLPVKSLEAPSIVAEPSDSGTAIGDKPKLSTT